MFHIVHFFLKSAAKLFCLYPEMLHNELMFIYLKFDYDKKQESQDSRNICCKCLVRNANPHKIQEHNKRQERVLSNSKLTETDLKETAFAVEGNTIQGKHRHQLHGEWSWHCKLTTPNSFLHPLPTSVLAGIRHKKSN